MGFSLCKRCGLKDAVKGLRINTTSDNQKVIPRRRTGPSGFQLMGMSVCLVDRGLGKDAKMGHDLLLTMTTERSLARNLHCICNRSQSSQELGK